MARLTATLLLMLLVSAARASAPVTVAVSIAPLAWLAGEIGGDDIQVVTLLGPNDSPATYAPGPRDLIALGQARAWLLAGVPFESVWASRIQADRPGLMLVDLTAGLPSRPTDGGDSDHGPVDPHRWTDPALFARMADPVLRTLAELDPEHADDFRRRHSELATALAALDQELERMLAPHAGRSFMAVHPSWGYFADAYDLRQIAIEQGGHEPGPRSLAGVIDRARRDDVRVLLVQRQFSRRTAMAVAMELDARLVEADPLAADYPDSLRRIATTLAESFE